MIKRLICLFRGHDESIYRSIVDYPDHSVELKFCHRCGGIASRKELPRDGWRAMWAQEFEHPELL
jgi:hypothetical protein